MSIPTVEYVYYNSETNELEIWGPMFKAMLDEASWGFPELTFLGAL